MNEHPEHTRTADQLIERLGDDLRELTQQHQSFRRKTLNQFIALAAVLAVAAIATTTDYAGLAIAALIASGFLLVYLAITRQKAWSRQVLERVMPAVCDLHERLKYASTVEDPRGFVEPWIRRG